MVDDSSHDCWSATRSQEPATSIKHIVYTRQTVWLIGDQIGSTRPNPRSSSDGEYPHRIGVRNARDENMTRLNTVRATPPSPIGDSFGGCHPKSHPTRVDVVRERGANLRCAVRGLRLLAEGYAACQLPESLWEALEGARLCPRNSRAGSSRISSRRTVPRSAGYDLSTHEVRILRLLVEGAPLPIGGG